jgi:hypothetical protein
MGGQAEWSPRAEVRGRALGLFFMTIFGACWVLAGVGVSGVDNPARLVIWVAGLVTTVGLLLVGLRLLADAGHLSGDVNTVGRARGRRLGWLFGLVFGAELVLIIAVSNALSALAFDRLILPSIAVVVGLHLVPLAAMFRVPVYYVTGCALVVLGLAGIVGILATGSEARWSAGVGFSVGVALWATAAVIALQARRIVQSSNRRQAC